MRVGVDTLAVNKPRRQAASALKKPGNPLTFFPMHTPLYVSHEMMKTMRDGNCDPAAASAVPTARLPPTRPGHGPVCPDLLSAALLPASWI